MSSETKVNAGHAALILGIVALVLAAGHSPTAFVLAIIALVLAFSDYKEVAVILSIIALAIAIIVGSGALIHV